MEITYVNQKEFTLGWARGTAAAQPSAQTNPDRTTPVKL